MEWAEIQTIVVTHTVEKLMVLAIEIQTNSNKISTINKERLINISSLRKCGQRIRSLVIPTKSGLRDQSKGAAADQGQRRSRRKRRKAAREEVPNSNKFLAISRANNPVKRAANQGKT